jgi:hypothetical protein
MIGLIVKGVGVRYLISNVTSGPPDIFSGAVTFLPRDPTRTANAEAESSFYVLLFFRAGNFQVRES